MIAELLLATAVTSSTCQVSYVQQYATPVYAQPVYAAPVTVFYSVGAQVQLGALVKQELRSNPEYRSFLRWQAERQAAPQASAPAPRQPSMSATGELPPPTPLPPGGAPAAAPGRTIANTCARCHGNNTPAGAFYLDGVTPLDEITRAVEMIMLGNMPPAIDEAGQPVPAHQPLTALEKFQLIEDLVRLKLPPEEN